MNTKDSFCNYCSQGKKVKAVGDYFPYTNGCSAFAFVIKSVKFVQFARLVVSS